MMASENQLNANGTGGEDADFDDVPAEGDVGQTGDSVPANPIPNALNNTLNPAATAQGIDANGAIGITNAAATVSNSNAAALPVNQLSNAPLNGAPINGAPLNGAAVVSPSDPMAPGQIPGVVAATDKPRLHWVGYDYLEKEGIVRIEMVTVGKPKFKFFQELNKAGQPELVVRFTGAEMRRKIRRDIDAREFKSPVAFVRLRKNNDDVDVVMTMRDAVKPRLFTKAGHVMLTFALPDRYFGNNAIGEAPIEQAQLLAAVSLMPDLVRGSDQFEMAGTPKPFINDPGAAAFKDAPPSAGAVVIPAMSTAPAMPTGAMPTSTTPASVTPTNATPAALPAMALPVANPNDMTVPQPQAMPAVPMMMPFPNQMAVPPAGMVVPPVMMMPNGRGAMPMTAPQMTAPAPVAPPANSDTKENDDSKLEDFDNGEGNSPETIDKFDVRLPSGDKDDGLIVINSKTLVGVAQDGDVGANAPAAPANNIGANANINANAAAKAALQNGAANAAGANLVGNQNINNANAANIEANLANQAAANAPANNAKPPENAANANGAAPANGNLTKNAPQVDLGGEAVAPNGAADELLGNPAPAPANQAPAAPAAPVVQAPFTPEPPLEGNPDLAGEEIEGSRTQAIPEGPSLGGRAIDLKFEDAPLPWVITQLGKESNVNFIIGPDVPRTNLSLHLKNVPFNDALNAVLSSYQLTVVSLGDNLYRIDKLKTIADERDDEDKRRRKELKLVPTKILVHRLSFAKADKVAPLLKTMLASATEGDPRIVVQADERTNSIIVNAPSGDLSTVKALLERLDLETPQVRIATRIVELKKGSTKSFGISWGMPLNFDQGRGLGFGNLVFPQSMLSKFSVDAGGNTQRTGTSNFFFGSANNSTALDLALSAQESQNTAEVLQSSSLIVGDNEKATIVAGTTDYFAPPAAGFGVPVQANPEDNKVEYNLTVKVTPHITADGAVQMDLDIKSDTPTLPRIPAGSRGAKLNRQVTTKMMRRSGETAVIGGIYNNERTKNNAGIPLLSKIPIIGALFRSSDSAEERRELMVMVTPTVITNSKSFEAPPSLDASSPTPASQEFAAPAPANNAPANNAPANNAPANNAPANNGGANANQQTNAGGNGGNFNGGLNGNGNLGANTNE
jgi:type IV pilus assembly protein PilQ